MFNSVKEIIENTDCFLKNGANTIHSASKVTFNFMDIRKSSLPNYRRTKYFKKAFEDLNCFNNYSFFEFIDSTIKQLLDCSKSLLDSCSSAQYKSYWEKYHQIVDFNLNNAEFFYPSHEIYEILSIQNCLNELLIILKEQYIIYQQLSKKKEFRLSKEDIITIKELTSDIQLIDEWLKRENGITIESHIIDKNDFNFDFSSRINFKTSFLDKYSTILAKRAEGNYNNTSLKEGYYKSRIKRDFEEILQLSKTELDFTTKIQASSGLTVESEIDTIKELLSELKLTMNMVLYPDFEMTLIVDGLLNIDFKEESDILFSLKPSFKNIFNKKEFVESDIITYRPRDKQYLDINLDEIKSGIAKLSIYEIHIFLNNFFN